MLGGRLESLRSDHMTYRGIVSNGVVVLEGAKPIDGTIVKVTPLDDSTGAQGPAAHPAIGIWKDRQDLPADPVEASKALRQKLMRRLDD